MRAGQAIILALSICAFSNEACAQDQRDIESRVAVCIACHGRVGSAGSTYYPRLSGKPSGYLFNQLVSFRDGRRLHSDMTWLVRNLSDGYLLEIADYFSKVELPYPEASLSTDASLAALEQGRKLVVEGDASRGIPACVRCHGPALTGVQPAIPPLIGLPRIYLSSQLGSWLILERRALEPDCMAQVGRKLNASDINAVASWISTRPIPADTAPARSPPQPLPLRCGGMG